jgi:hypothetical protein
MKDPWQHLARRGRKNGVDCRVRSEAFEREWLTGLFSSLGLERSDSDTLLERMRERREIVLRNAIPPVTLQKPGRGLTR